MSEERPRLSEISSKIQNSIDSHDDKTKVFWSQRLASFILSLVLLLVGLANGWSSPYLAQLMLKEDIDGIPQATESELTWLATLMNAARIFGAFVGAVAQDTIGRKWSLYFSGVPMIGGWISGAVADSVQWLYAYRVLCGISMGMIWTTLSHYIAEIADPQIRGSLARRFIHKFDYCRDCRHFGIAESLVKETNVAKNAYTRPCIEFVSCCIYLKDLSQILWNIACHGIGIFVGNAMGPYISMKTYAYICIGINILFLGLFVMIPESPYRYISEGNMDKAESALKWFRRSKNVKSELSELEEYVNNSKATFKQRINELKQSRYRKCFLLMFLINIFLYFGAANVLTNYMEILITMSQVPINASTVVTVIGFCSMVAALMATFLIDIFGRRRLLIIASVINAVAMTSLGIHFQLLKLGYDPATLTWLPCSCLLVSIVSFHGGTGCVPNALIGELFSPALKTIASLCFSATAALFSSLSTATFLPILNLVGPNYVFWFYASGLYVSAVYYYFCLPETMGKSLKDIQKDIRD